MGAARALDEVRLLQQRDDALQVGERQPLRLGDRLERDGSVPPLAAELDEEESPEVVGVEEVDEVDEEESLEDEAPEVSLARLSGR